MLESVMLENLPFIHFMVKKGTGRDAELLSPAEIQENLYLGGSFFIPVRNEGHFLPAYRFDFSIYIGAGRFMKGEAGNRIFTGIAFQIHRHKELLFCAFEYPFMEG